MARPSTASAARPAPGPVELRGQPQLDVRVGVVEGAGEGQPVGVVPVQVGQQQRPPERLAAQPFGEAAGPGPRVQHEGGPLAVGRDGHARGVAAVADELRPGGRGRPPHPQEVELHQALLVLPPVALGHLGQHSLVDPVAGRARPPCTSSPPAASRCAARPRAPPARRAARRVRARPAARRRPRPRARRRAGGTARRRACPCSTSSLPFFTLRMSGFSPAFITCSDSVALEGGLDRGDERRRVLVAPRRVLAEGLAVPLLEVDHAGLGDDLAAVVVEPVAGERAGADQLGLGPAVGVERELRGCSRRAAR